MERLYKDEVKRILPIFQAMAEGKTIQWSDNGMWKDIDGDEEGLYLDTLIDKPNNYRIKPSSTYRPFANADECWNEMLKHQPVGWVYHKESKSKILIRAIEYYLVFTSTEYSFDDAFGAFTFTDNTPFGIKEED